MKIRACIPLFLFLACAVSYQVEVNSLASPEATTKKKFVILPGMEGVELQELQFQEFARYVKKALESKGYTEAQNAYDADVAVFLNYGIGAPKETVYFHTKLVYGRTGGGTSTIDVSSVGPDGYSHTTGTITTPSTRTVVG
jgi:hypothetical protein